MAENTPARAQLPFGTELRLPLTTQTTPRRVRARATAAVRRGRSPSSRQPRSMVQTGAV